MAKVSSSKKSASARSTARDDRDEVLEEFEFDANAYFADAGLKYKEEDLRDVGGLMPIYASEYAAEEKWPPLFGLLLGIRMIEVDKTARTAEEGTRPFLIVEAEVATKALSGTGDDRQSIDIEPGDRLLMPISGALKNRDELLTAAMDADEVHRALFIVTGRKVKMKKAGRNDMWEVVTKMVDDPIPRRGRYVFNPARTPEISGPVNGVPALPRGEVINARGQVNPSLVG